MSDLIRRSVLIDEICRSSIYKWSVEEDQAAHNWALNIINSQPSVESSKGDLISRADAIEAVCGKCSTETRMECALNGYFCCDRRELEALPSAELPKGDLISRADVLKYPIRLDHYDEENGSREFVYGVESVIEYVESLPSADAIPTVIRAKTFMRKEDFDKWAEDIKKQNKSIVCIPCDAELVSADAVHGEWLYVENEPYSECSKCGRYIDDLDEDKYAYCPYCGSRMKGGAE